MSMSKGDLDGVLIRLGESLHKKTRLTLIGSAVNIEAGQDARFTMDIDVWQKTSNFDYADLKQACEQSGICFDPKEYEVPDGPYLQLISEGVVDIGGFTEKNRMMRTGNLVVEHPPIENLVASKLLRGYDRDYEDMAFLCSKADLSRAQIEAAIATLKPHHQETASENLTVLSILLGDESACPAP